MKRWACALTSAALAACSPPAPAPAPPATTAEIPAAGIAQPGCSTEASRDWSAAGGQYFIVEADAYGDSCANATVTIRFRSRGGAILYERAYRLADIPLAFNPNADRATLRADLEAWIANTAGAPTADWLPPWTRGAERPPGFQPATTRNFYEAARGAQGPLFCYPDGGESNACLALAGERVTLLGSLTPESE